MGCSGRTIAAPVRRSSRSCGELTANKLAKRAAGNRPLFCQIQWGFGGVKADSIGPRRHAWQTEDPQQDAPTQDDGEERAGPSNSAACKTPPWREDQDSHTMVAFIIFGVFALTRRFGRVFLIPVLSARSASFTERGRGMAYHFATALAARSASRRPCGDVSSARFATALSARSASAKADKLCLYHAP